MVSNLRRYFASFLEGMGSISLFPNNDYKPYWMKSNLTPEQQDTLAIKGDWEKVGEDLKISMNNFKKSLHNKL